jgi:nucleotide-binding universal stress UspA family protein
MIKHFLLTIGEQKVHHGVRFLGSFFSSKEKIKITLFYTTPRPPALWDEDETTEGNAEREEQMRKTQKTGRKALESAEKELIRLGFAPDQIDSKLQVRLVSKSAEIIQEGELGLYDAVILGRRGLSWLEAAFDESVTREVLASRVGFPFWVCRSFDVDRRHVLVCLDGSEAAYKVTDHVGFILGNQREHTVTLLMVTKKESTEEAQEVFSKGKKLLLNGGLPEEMIKTKLVQEGNAARAVLKEAREGGFAVVAAGRTGTGQSAIKRVFLGSVSNALFREIEGAVLWVCHE